MCSGFHRGYIPIPSCPPVHFLVYAMMRLRRRERGIVLSKELKDRKERDILDTTEGFELGADLGGGW